MQIQACASSGNSIEKRPQQRGARLVCGAHERAHIGTDQFADADELREQRFHLRAVAPDLVRRALIEDRLASFVDVVRLGQTRAVQAQSPGRRCPTGTSAAAAHGNAGSRMSPLWKPPMSVVHQGMPAHAHVHAGADLAAERFPRARNIAGPDKRAVPLAARPGAAHQAHGVFPRPRRACRQRSCACRAADRDCPRAGPGRGDNGSCR